VGIAASIRRWHVEFIRRWHDAESIRRWHDVESIRRSHAELDERLKTRTNESWDGEEV
jgi:hypothetical protein